MARKHNGAAGAALAAFLLAAQPATADEFTDPSSGYGQEDQRVVLVYGEVNDEMARNVIGRLRHLAQKSSDPIEMHINSPGGSVTDGLAIYDVMMSVAPPIKTICMGECASMGAFLLAAGAPGHRAAYPNANIMHHQPSGGGEASAKATAQMVNTAQSAATKQQIERILSLHTGLDPYDLADIMRDDAYMTPQTAQQMGFIDKVVPHAKTPTIARKPVMPDAFCDALDRRRTIAACSPRRMPN